MCWRDFYFLCFLHIGVSLGLVLYQRIGVFLFCVKISLAWNFYTLMSVFCRKMASILHFSCKVRKVANFFEIRRDPDYFRWNSPDLGQIFDFGRILGAARPKCTPNGVRYPIMRFVQKCDARIFKIGQRFDFVVCGIQLWISWIFHT